MIYGQSSECYNQASGSANMIPAVIYGQSSECYNAETGDIRIADAVIYGQSSECYNEGNNTRFPTPL